MNPLLECQIDTNRTIELLSKIKQRINKVIIEHDTHVVFSLADRISVLAQGHVIATGLPDEIRKSSKVKEAYLGGRAMPEVESTKFDKSHPYHRKPKPSAGSFSLVGITILLCRKLRRTEYQL